MGRHKSYDRDVLLNETVQLFWKNGLADTTLADIESSSGVNKSSLYSEFTDKNDIFVASLNHYIHTNGVYDILSRAPLGRDNIAAFLRIGKSCVGQRGCFVVNSLRESAILPGEAIELIRSHLKKVKEKLVDNIKAARFKGDAGTFAELVLTFNAGLCIEANNSRTPPDHKIESFLELMKI